MNDVLLQPVDVSRVGVVGVEGSAHLRNEVGMVRKVKGQDI